MRIRINDVYRQIIDSHGTLRKDVRYFDVWGGRRSGKSFDVAQILGVTALAEPGHFIPMIRKVGATLKDSIWAEQLDFFIRNSIPVRVNRSDKEIILQNGSRFRGFGLDDPEKLKSLKGATIIRVEEANEITEGDLDSIDSGLSPTNYPGQIVFTHNPTPQIPGSPHWLQTRFSLLDCPLSTAQIDRQARSLVLRTWYEDNAFCSDDYKMVLDRYRTTNPALYKLWALGEYTSVEGAVFDNWDTVPCVPPGIVHDSQGVALDFGFSNDPAACARIWVHDNDIYVKQLVYKTGLSSWMLKKELMDAGVRPYDLVVADSARPDLISDLCEGGLYGVMGVQKHAGYKEEAVNRILNYRLHFIEGDTDAIREVSTYAWARDRNGKPLPKLQDGNDHLMDCLTMFMSNYFKDHSILDVV